MTEEFEREAQTLLASLRSGEEAAAWRFKWAHPRFRDQPVIAVREAAVDLTDAQAVIAREHGFEEWSDVARFVRAADSDDDVRAFEAAADAVVSGDLDTLQSLVREHPSLVHARSIRRHHATLLHYIAANGVENVRQKTRSNAVAVARFLLEAGAEVDALADMYDARCTTMNMLVSSSPPAEAGLQAELAEVLVTHGAILDGTAGQSPVLTALAFGYYDTAVTLARHRDDLGFMELAGLGRLDGVARLLPDADASSRHIALALAAQHGHADIVRLLLDAGEDPDRYNPDGYHAHSTPLHQAAGANHPEVVRLIVERGARLDQKDTIYSGTPLDWAKYCDRPAVADYLRERGAP